MKTKSRMVQQHVNEDHGLDVIELELSDSRGFKFWNENEGRNANVFDTQITYKNVYW